MCGLGFACVSVAPAESRGRVDHGERHVHSAGAGRCARGRMGMCMYTAAIYGGGMYIVWACMAAAVVAYRVLLYMGLYRKTGVLVVRCSA